MHEDCKPSDCEWSAGRAKARGEVAALMDAGMSRPDAEAAVITAAKEDWERRQLQRSMNETIAKVFSKVRPARVAKHPRGATKASVAARKAKNRKKAKTNRRNR